jgi:hypothetical protein
MGGLKDGQTGAPTAVPTGAPATTAVAQGPTAPAVVPTGVPTTAAASKGLAMPASGPAGALALAVRKGGPIGWWGLAGRPVGGWPPAMPAVVATGVPTTAAAAKELAAGPAGALVPAAMKGGPTEG